MGSHSTGKTTLLEHCKAQLGARLCTIEDIPRSVIARGFPLGKSATVDSFVNYVHDQLLAERTLQDSSNRLLISVRTILDAAAYAAVNRLLPRPFVPVYFIDMLYEIARIESKMYDLFVEFPVVFPIVADGVRDIDPVYRDAVGEEVSRLLDKLKLPRVVLSGDTSERYQQFLARVDDVQRTS